MGACSSWIRDRRAPRKKVKLAMFGLDNAGKTVTAKGLKGESLDTVAPTIGFSTTEIPFERDDITLYDIGGGKRIRDIWKNYYSEIYGMLFIVDSTEVDRMDECRQVLTSVLEDPRITGKPFLLLANKQDCPGAMDELDVCQHLNLEELVNINKCPCRVETCSAILGQGRKMDPSIIDGMKWLMQTIHQHWEKLSLRIEKDVEEQMELEKREKKKRAEAVHKKREEREKKEKEERRARGELSEDSDTAQDFKNGDPFKRVDVDELTQKQQKLKEEKFRRKKLDEIRNKSVASDSDDPDERPAPRSSKAHSRTHRPNHRGAVPSDDSDEAPGLFGRNRRRVSPPSTPQLNRRNINPPSYSDNDEVETSFASKSPWMKKRSPRPPEPGHLPSLTARSNRGLNDDQLDMPPPARGRSLMPIGHLEPLDTDNDTDVDSRRKKKKKRVRRNQVSAAEDDDLKSDSTSIASNDLGAPQPHGWGTPPGQRSVMKASRTPRLEAPKEDQEHETKSFSERWGLAEDLPDMPDSSSYRRTRPNVDSGDEIMT